MSYRGLPLSVATHLEVATFFAVSRTELSTKIQRLLERSDILGDYHVNVDRDGNELTLGLTLPKGHKFAIDAVLNGVHAMTVIIEELFAIARTKCSVKDGEPSLIIQGSSNAISVTIKRTGIAPKPIVDSFDVLKDSAGFFIPNRESNGKYNQHIRFIRNEVRGRPELTTMFDDYVVHGTTVTGRAHPAVSNIQEVPRGTSEGPRSVFIHGDIHHGTWIPDTDLAAVARRHLSDDRRTCQVCAEAAHNAVDEYVNERHSFRIPENTCTQIHE